MLSEDELHALDGSLLPTLERHHLRLLAHSLRCLQAAATDAGLPTDAGPALKDPDSLQAWAARQPGLVADPTFRPVLLEQLGKAALQLDQIGVALAKPPLALTLDDLLAWGKACADARIRDSSP